MAKKIQVSTLTSFEEVDAALLELGRHTAVVQTEEAHLNEKIQSLRESSEAQTADARQRILSLTTDIELFCNQHKDEFEKPRTRELTHGTVGFKMTPGKVALLNRKYNWETVTELLKKMRWGSRYLRTVVEVDKEKILADARDKTINDTKLASAGMKIAQPDDFVCEIKWDTIE